MTFYCAGAIRGDTSYQEYFDKIVEIVSLYGEPKTERFGYTPLTDWTESMKKEVYERDIAWIRKSGAIIAECSGPSYGTGHEVAYGTRIVRIPVLGLYHASSFPSLMLTQDNSKYVFPQQYSNERELESYLRLFLELISKFDSIDDIRKNYLKYQKEVPKLDPQGIRSLVESLSRKKISIFPVGVQGELELDIEHITVVRPDLGKIDFKDSTDLVEFTFKNLVLQKRWSRLKSQRIGTTFVSGRKYRIIEALSRFDGPTSLLHIYQLHGKDRLGYTRKAFTKNVRAYRRIGLFEVPKKIESLRRGTTKFRDRYMVFKTWYGDFTIKSSVSPREIMNNLIIVTRHLNHLADFLRSFSSASLIASLNDAREKEWYSKMPDISVFNIDKVSIASFLKQEWAQQLTAYLHSTCKEFWREHYSSFA